MNISQDQLLELTSWQKLTSDEFDLFQAVKKYVVAPVTLTFCSESVVTVLVFHDRWKVNGENSTGTSVSCGRNDGGIFQNIRFALLTQEQLADDLILVS